MKTTRILALSLASALTLTSFSVTALAAETAAPSKAVTYADLNLETPAGKQALEMRIARAAREVCQSNLDLSDRGAARSEYNRCRENAIAHATSQIASASHYERVAIH